ncbi:MAG TPA: hypothetical protein VGG20_27965, partial [Thermoanaerobaculia bacterium]
MADLIQDIRFAVRLLGKKTWLSVIAVASLALGIGSTTAVFSLGDALLLRPLPAVHQPSELVAVFSVADHSP